MALLSSFITLVPAAILRIIASINLYRHCRLYHLGAIPLVQYSAQGLGNWPGHENRRGPKALCKVHRVLGDERAGSSQHGYMRRVTQVPGCQLTTDIGVPGPAFEIWACTGGGSYPDRAACKLDHTSWRVRFRQISSFPLVLMRWGKWVW